MLAVAHVEMNGLGKARRFYRSQVKSKVDLSDIDTWISGLLRKQATGDDLNGVTGGLLAKDCQSL